MPRQGINCPDLAPPVGPFSHLVTAGEALYLSGQVAQDPTSGKLIEGDVAAQTTRIFANLQAVLKTVDRDLSHVVQVWVFLTDMADFAEWNLYEQGICREFYTGVSRDVCKSGHGSAVSTLVGEYLRDECLFSAKFASFSPLCSSERAQNRPSWPDNLVGECSLAVITRTGCIY